MRILVTNDDGMAAAGLAELARVATQTGAEVVVAAPSGEQSGSGASLSAVETGAGVAQERVIFRDVSAIAAAYSVQASPAVIAALAAEGEFGDPPDLVLSGINHGPNTGHAILHSGTVGAALTAAARGVPAVAFSVATSRSMRWNTAVFVADKVVRWATIHAPRGAVINVNIPDIAPSQLRGLRSARLATFGAAQAQITTPRDTQTVTIAQDGNARDPESDTALLAAGWATVTAVVAPFEVKWDLDQLTGPTRSEEALGMPTSRG